MWRELVGELQVVPPHFVGAVPKRKAAPPRELPEAEEAHSRGRARSPPQILAAVSKRKARPRSMMLRTT
eukprot:6454825-Amphidinium_carterae.2